MINRRHFIEAAVGVALVGASLASLRFRKVSDTWLRPPGALPPGDFEAACIRCFRCAEVCPPRCIVFDASLPPAEADTPFIHSADKACILCMQCAPVCPTGALVQLAAVNVRMGEPLLNKQTCFAHNGTRPCRLCVDVCPFQGSAVTLNDRLAPVFHDACVGCGLCEEACPVQDKAIQIRPRSTPETATEADKKTQKRTGRLL